MCGIKSRSLPVLLVGFSLLLPAYSWAGEYDNLSKEELINLVEQLEKVLTPAENKAIELENSLKKAETSQKELADTFQTLVKSYEKLSKSLNPGIRLGLDFGLLAIPETSGKLQLGLYGGITFQF